MDGKVCIIETTLPASWIEAEIGAFSQQMLDAGAACVQHSSICSIYRWDGEIQSTPEWHLRMKVTPSKQEDVLAALRHQHPYEVPQIIWTTVQSTAEYSGWVAGDNR